MPYVNSKNVEEIVILTGGRQKILDELGQPLKIVHLSPVSQKKVTWAEGKTFFTLFKLNITFYFKCYFHHNYSINLN